jgi:hypothetical protein
MPTPPHVFADIAATYGNVNPNDSAAVQKWYIETLPTLKPERIDEILEVLLRHDGGKPTASGEKSYPVSVPLPLLNDSPPANLPILRAVIEVFNNRIWKRMSSKK